MWNKIVKFFKKYDALLVILIGVLLIIYLFKKLIAAVIENVNATTCFLHISKNYKWVGKVWQYNTMYVDKCSYMLFRTMWYFSCNTDIRRIGYGNCD